MCKNCELRIRKGWRPDPLCRSKLPTDQRCLDCGKPIYAYANKQGKLYYLNRFGDKHKPECVAATKYPNRYVRQEKDSVGYFGDHGTHADKER